LFDQAHGAHETPDSCDMRPNPRRAFRLAAVEGFLFQTGMSMTEASLVLSVLLKTLGASATVVGSLSAIRFAGWSLPQILVANNLESRRHRMPVYRFGNGVRFPMYFAMAALVAFLGPSRPTLTIALFIAIYAASRIVAGIAAAARNDILGKVIEPQALSEFFALRSLIGAVGGFLSGFLIKWILSENGVSYPWNFGVLLALSGIIFGIAWAVFYSIVEPPTEKPVFDRSLATHLTGIKLLLREDVNFKRYLLVRILLSFVQVISPFYALYAMDRIAIDASMVGTYLSILTLARFIANPLWGRLGRNWGPQAVLRISATLSAVVPMLAVGIPLLGATTGWVRLPFFAYVYGLVYLVSGAAGSGAMIAHYSYVLAIAPPERRPTYVGLSTAVRGVMNVVGIAVGQAIDLWGYAAIFIVASALIAWGAGLSFRLRGTAHRNDPNI